MDDANNRASLHTSVLVYRKSNPFKRISNTRVEQESHLKKGWVPPGVGSAYLGI